MKSSFKRPMTNLRGLKSANKK